MQGYIYLEIFDVIVVYLYFELYNLFKYLLFLIKNDEKMQFANF